MDIPTAFKLKKLSFSLESSSKYQFYEIGKQHLYFVPAFIFLLKWGSEIRKHSKSGLFKGQIANCPYLVGFQMVPTIRKLEKL